MTKIFKTKKKPYFGVIFAQREFFLKTMATYNCRGPLVFKYQRYRVDWSSNQKSLQRYQQAKIVQSICSIHHIICRYTWFKSPVVYKATLNFDYAHPIIISVTFSFPKFVSACLKSTNFINLVLRCSRFQSLNSKKATPVFDHQHPKIVKVTFGFSEFLSTHQKSVYSINFFLRYSEFWI